ncbi:anti-sigma factor domain-containing protein [Pelagibacterium sp.]|uniref:anti-sigma factor n=1 Tax=Pelagibacterium sp. TaxID=1967288 RepID=UPI003A92BA59
MTAPNNSNDLIAQYVLGLLEAEEQIRFESRMAVEPDLARKVTVLQHQFQALDDTARPDTVPDRLWSRIETSINAATGAPKAANTNTKRSLGGIPAWAGMAAAIVVSLGIGFFGGQSLGPAPQAPLVVAVLVGDDMEPGAIIEAFADDSIRIVPLEALVAPADSILEVWTLPDAETGPVSLGTFREARDLVLGGPDLPAPQPDQLYEITLEPAGGSPTGRPTGPILLKGFARAPVV